jgi:hypothetical protein
VASLLGLSGLRVSSLYAADLDALNVEQGYRILRYRIRDEATIAISHV